MLTENQYEVLSGLEAELRAKYSLRNDRFATPLMLGGYNGSHHSTTLSRLAKKGWVERKRRGGWGRGSYVYKITDAGLEALKAHKAERS